MARGFVYLIAIVDWFSRRVLAWRLSITLETDFCIEALEEALTPFGAPEIFNTDQGSQLTFKRSSQQPSGPIERIRQMPRQVFSSQGSSVA
jgi:transposase InsO family protein